MSKKHFIAIAKAINDQFLQSDRVGPEASLLQKMAESLATIFADANPLFDRARFLAACFKGDK